MTNGPLLTWSLIAPLVTWSMITMISSTPNQGTFWYIPMDQGIWAGLNPFEHSMLPELGLSLRSSWTSRSSGGPQFWLTYSLRWWYLQHGPLSRAEERCWRYHWVKSTSKKYIHTTPNMFLVIWYLQHRPLLPFFLRGMVPRWSVLKVSQGKYLFILDR